MSNKPRIAIQNLHKLPNLCTWKLHNYAVDLVRHGHVEYLYFGELRLFSNWRTKLSALNQIRKKYRWKELGLNKVKFLFTKRALNKHCDILLNFNMTQPEDFTPAVKQFKGMKIFHLMDYFWMEPGSKKYARLKEFGIDYVMSYSSSDKNCPYFQKIFPGYKGKVIPVPFGYSERFRNTTPFSERKNKCVALGSVNPFRPADAEPIKYQETADFYLDLPWLHKFRRMIVENLPLLGNEIDSMLPVFPLYKEYTYDIVKKFNEYRMWVSDETMFFFPTAKSYEGTACGTVMVCSDHPCFAEFGFVDGENCIMHRRYDIAHMKERISYYQNHPIELEAIQKRSTEFIRTLYSQPHIADGLMHAISTLYSAYKDSGKLPNTSDFHFWPYKK